jgi:MFS family permease
VTLLCFTLFFFGALQSGTPVGFMDIAPNFSSEMNTIATVFLSCAGFLTPLTVASFQRQYSEEFSWQGMFYLSFFICSFAVLVWRIFCISEIIPELNHREH